MNFSLVKLIYPRRCVFCERFLDKNVIGDICGDCLRSLPYTGAGFKTKGEFFSLCVSPLYYEGGAAKAVIRFKFRRKSSYARCMGQMIARCAGENLSGRWDVLTYVPISRRRKRTRGYCQASLLAKEAAKQLGVKCERLLVKRRHTPPQSSLGGLAERKANISGAFEAVNRDKISGRNILLIDDVITTGATMAECARILLTAGANSVVCATLCKTKRYKK